MKALSRTWRTGKLILLSAMFCAFVMDLVLSSWLPQAAEKNEKIRPGLPIGNENFSGKTNSQPASNQISHEAQSLLTNMRMAYGSTRSAEMNGSIQVNFDVNGQKQKMDQTFTSAYADPNKFRHELKDELTIGSTGENTYVFNKAANQYILVDPPKGKTPAPDLPQPISQILQTQNPNLLFLLIKDPIQELTQTAELIEKLDDQTLDQRSYPVLRLTQMRGLSKATLLIDSQSFLVRRMTIDMSKAAEQAGVSNVASALITIDYPLLRTNVTFGAKHFEWNAPEGAKRIDIAGAQAGSNTAVLDLPDQPRTTETPSANQKQR